MERKKEKKENAEEATIVNDRENGSKTGEFPAWHATQEFSCQHAAQEEEGGGQEEGRPGGPADQDLAQSGHR